MTSFIWIDKPHSNFVLKSVYHMQKEHFMCDVILKTENEKIHAHKLVLCAVSPYFRSLDNMNFKESIDNEIEFQDIAYDILKSIVDFTYSGKIEINEQNVFELMSACHLLQISVLKIALSQFILRNLNIKNSLECLAYAKLYGYEDVTYEILKYISKYFHFVVRNEMFIKTPIDIVKDVICQRSLTLFDICDAFEKWLKHNSNIKELSCNDCTVNEYLDKLFSIKDENDKKLLNLIEGLEIIIKEKSKDMHKFIKEENTLKEKKVILTIGGSSVDTIWSNVECLVHDTYFSMSFPKDTILLDKNAKDKTFESVIIQPMNEPRMCFSCVQKNSGLNNGSIVYVLGGLGTASTGIALNFCEKFDVRNNKWSFIKPLPKKLKDTAAIMADNVLYLTGGLETRNNVSGDVWEYYDKDDIWKLGSNLQEPRYAHGMCSVQGTLYVLGGKNIRGSILSSVERYNSDLRSWFHVTEIPEAKFAFGCVAINEFIYVIGGGNKSFVLSSVHRYNILTDKWENCSEMPTDKMGFGCTVKDNKIYCIGGSSSVQGPLAKVEVYNSKTDRWTYLQDKLLAKRNHCCSITVKILTESNVQKL